MSARVFAAAGCLITTFAFNGTTSTFTEGMEATALSVSPISVAAVTVDASDNVYIAVAPSISRVFKVSAGTSTLQLVAGTGSTSSSGDGGSAKLAGVAAPRALAVDSDGTLYILDSNSP